MSSGASDLHEVTVQVHHKTAKAILVSDDGDKNKAKWLPLSQCEVEDLKDGIAIITAPIWLFRDKGLL
jgi:hypothetical protein